MIPKTIHYVWLGEKEKPNFVNACILTWKEHMPDCQIIEWNETNLDLDKLAQENKFFCECRKRKLWAYMADYLRLKILYEQGGIYFDTDIQVLKNFEQLFEQSYLLGMETKEEVSSAVIGCEKGNEVIKKMLDFYQQGIWDEHIYVITYIMTEAIKKYEKETNKKIIVYPKKYFSPIQYQEKFTGECITDDTYTVHWFTNTWSDKREIHTFLEIKHIKNPIKRRILYFKKVVGYYCRKFK